MQKNIDIALYKQTRMTLKRHPKRDIEEEEIVVIIVCGMKKKSALKHREESKLH